MYLLLYNQILNEYLKESTRYCFLYEIPKSLILYSLTDTTISGAGSFPKESRKHTCPSNEIMTRPLND